MQCEDARVEEQYGHLYEEVGEGVGDGEVKADLIVVSELDKA